MTRGTHYRIYLGIRGVTALKLNPAPFAFIDMPLKEGMQAVMRAAREIEKLGGIKRAQRHFLAKRARWVQKVRKLGWDERAIQTALGTK